MWIKQILELELLHSKMDLVAVQRRKTRLLQSMSVLRL